MKLRQIPEVERYFEVKSVGLWDWLVLVPKWWENKNDYIWFWAKQNGEA